MSLNKKVNQLINRSSPTGAAKNTAFFTSDIDRELLEAKQAAGTAMEVPKRVFKSKRLTLSPARCSKSDEYIKCPKIIYRKKVLPSILPPRWKSVPMHLDPCFGKYKYSNLKIRSTPKINQERNQKKARTMEESIENFKHERHIDKVLHFETELYELMAEQIDTISDYLNSPTSRRTLKDAIKDKIADKKINRKCYEDSIQLKKELRPVRMNSRKIKQLIKS